MKILVTGATGYIGGAVAHRLAARGHSIQGLARSCRAVGRLGAAGIEPVSGDYEEPASMMPAVDEVDAVISTASIGHAKCSSDGIARDRDAIAAMIAGARPGIPFIFTSTSAVLGTLGDGQVSPLVFDEDSDVPLPRQVCALAPATAAFADQFAAAMQAKVETEQLVLGAPGVQGIVLRPGLVYGRGGGYDLPNLIRLTERLGYGPHLGDGQVRQGYVHIDDLLDLYVLALENAPGRTVLHAVTGEIALGALAEAASRLAGFGGRTAARSLAQMFADADDAGISLSLNKRLSSEKTRALLGWRPSRDDILEDAAHGSYRTMRLLAAAE